jgi:uncharacterized protein YqeY
MRSTKVAMCSRQGNSRCRIKILPLFVKKLLYPGGFFTFVENPDMSIEEKVNGDIKTAMLAKDAKRLEALRAIKSVILLLKTSPEGLTDDSVNKALQKEVKKRKESADIYKSQNRADLEENEMFQAGVIEEYLPKQLSEADIRSEIQKIIAQTGAKGAGDLGKVMGQASKAFAGRADNKIVSGIVRELLS